jgi:hypothetical protein
LGRIWLRQGRDAPERRRSIDRPVKKDYGQRGARQHDAVKTCMRKEGHGQREQENGDRGDQPSPTLVARCHS